MHPTRPTLSDEIPGWLAELRDELDAELLTTHISWLLLTAEHAYKFKRPLRLPFVDYSTPKARWECCRRELQLNRRYAPQLYLEVERLGPTNEPAVVMRRFGDSQRADHLVAARRFGADEVGELVSQVLALHSQAPIAAPGAALGSPGSIWRWVDATLQGLRGQRGDAAALARLTEWCQEAFDRLTRLMTQRQQGGWIREGHGDLHLQNVVVFEGQVLPYDCIEFNSELRWLDIANELSFTYLDLLRAQRPDLAAALVNQWFTAAADVEGLALLSFYTVKGALVRAMVAGDEGDTHAKEMYLDVATSLATEPSARLTITHGVAGSGKSTRAKELTRLDPAARTIWLRSDVERKRLHGLDALESSGSAQDAGIYSAEATAATYRRLADLASRLLRAGWSVVVDAAFLQRWQRDDFRTVAAKAVVPFTVIECAAEPDELRRRVVQRRSDPSEATLTVLEDQLTNYRPLDPDERSNRCRTTHQTSLEREAPDT